VRQSICTREGVLLKNSGLLDVVRMIQCLISADKNGLDYCCSGSRSPSFVIFV